MDESDSAERVRQTPEDDEGPHDQCGWSRLSIPAFARDWNSDADAIYDEPAPLDLEVGETLALP